MFINSNAQMRRFIFALLIAVTVLTCTVACSSDDTSGKKEVNNGSVQPNTQPVPTFSAEAFKLISDPCTTISIESVNQLVPDSQVSGSLQQNSVGPNKTCEWKYDEKSFPRLGISIIEATNFFNPADTRIIEDPTLGEKVFVAPEYVIVLGGDSCGNTLYVVAGKYSFSVAYCDKDGKPATDEILLALAGQVKNSLPVT